MANKHDDPLSWVHGKDRAALRALLRIYGDDTDTVLNALHAMAVRIAIGTGVEPDRFAEGVKQHWDFVVGHINEQDASSCCH